MLVNHSYSFENRLVRVQHFHWLTFDEDLPLVGLVQTKQNIHQRRFSSAIFPNDCQNLSREQANVYLIAGEYPGESLRDLSHF